MTIRIKVRDLGRNKLHAQAAEALKQLFADTSLYSPLTLEPDLGVAVIEALYVDGFRFDSHCLWCKRESVFSMPHILDEDRIAMLKSLPSVGIGADHDIDSSTLGRDLSSLPFECARNSSHRIEYVCQLSTQYNYDVTPIEVQSFTLSKYGQRPSHADIAQGEIRKYAKILEQEDFKELNRAIGLNSHDIGIGSFVYLRRIFERLVNKTVDKLDRDLEEKEEILSLRMDDKIQALKDYLPSFLVEHRNLYKILSLGIHELGETECLQAFPAVRLGIELILDEKIELDRRRRKIKGASSSIQKLGSSLGKK